MSEIALEFKTEDVVIAEDGRVIINNKAFARSLVEYVKVVAPGTVGFFDNCDCKGKAISEVSLSEVMPVTTLKIDPGIVGIFDNCDCKSRLDLTREEMIR